MGQLISFLVQLARTAGTRAASKVATSGLGQKLKEVAMNKIADAVKNAGKAPKGISGVGSKASKGESSQYGISGVGFYATTTIKPEKAAQDEIVETEAFKPGQLGEGLIEGEVVEAGAENRSQLNEGFIDAEIIEEVDIDAFPDFERKLLSPASDEDDEYIEIEWEDVSDDVDGEDLYEPKSLSPTAELEEIYEEEAEELDAYGISAATSFTEDEFETDLNFSDNRGFLDGDFVEDQSGFVANSFEAQGALAPFYPSEDLPFAGFSDPKDLLIEADFSFGGADF